MTTIIKWLHNFLGEFPLDRTILTWLNSRFNLLKKGIPCKFCFKNATNETSFCKWLTNLITYLRKNISDDMLIQGSILYSTYIVHQLIPIMKSIPKKITWFSAVVGGQPNIDDLSICPPNIIADLFPFLVISFIE